MVFEVDGVPLYYTREVENMMGSNSSLEVYHVNDFKEAVHFWRKLSPLVNVIFDLNYK